MRRAIVMGSNGPAGAGQLRYAQQDAQRLAAILSGPRCGFAVDLIQSSTDPWDVRRQIFRIAEECTHEDTLICYFSGHGIVERGALFLLWDNTELERLLNTAVPVEDIVRALKYCKANSKLLILDCCHAGAVVNMTGFKDGASTAVRDLEITPDNHLVLMASDRLEKTRELDILNGSFLTTNLCIALDEKFDNADKDGDKRLSVHDLKNWLDARAKEHNKKNPSLAVPYPYLFGQQRGEFYLTVAESPWVPYEIPWPDGSTMVVLPIRPRGDRAILMGKHPIINEQYQRFQKAVNYPEPTGKHFVDNRWQGPFYPWREPEFLDPKKPVVCVSLTDASNYCKWVSKLSKQTQYTSIPSPTYWDIAAFGGLYLAESPHIWLESAPMIHHNAFSPAIIDEEGGRTNPRGLSDMVGNVWEWCMDLELRWAVATLAIHDDRHPDVEVRGGGFLDDLTRTRPFLHVLKLKGRQETVHSDLGFRISATIPVGELPSVLQQKLLLCPQLPKSYELLGIVRSKGPIRGGISR